MSALAHAILSDPSGARSAFALAFDPAVFLAALRQARPEYAYAPAPADPLALYLVDPELARLDANALFEEGWYRRAYPDVEAAIRRGDAPSGLYHFVACGWLENRFPCFAMKARAELKGHVGPEPDAGRFDEAAYLAANPEARLVLAHFPHLDAWSYARTLGRALDVSAPPARAVQAPGPDSATDDLCPIRAAMKAEFDPDFYFDAYLTREEPKADWAHPFAHYMSVGRLKGYSPSPDFSEGWYLAFNADVRDAVQRGELLCGFHHFLKVGREEGRAAKFDLVTALEHQMPGITSPVLLQRSCDLAERLKPMPCKVVQDRQRTLWVVLPRLNPDISYGGFRAGFELIAALKPWLAARGVRLSLIVLEEGRANRDYFLWRSTNPRLRRAFADMEMRSRHEIEAVEIGPRDRFLAYSTWDMIFASPLAALTDEPRVITLVQEYEAVFHDFGAMRAVVDWAFELPSYPVFNSAVLKRYFVEQRVGLFKAAPEAEAGPDFAVFEHVVNRLPTQSALQMRARDTRTLALYARPEGHAGRNLYELAELALKQLCGQGLFDNRWRFVGLGCLAPLPPVELGGGHVLEFMQKMGEETYAGFMRGLDIGVSLMYAPHPSVVPFEFATTGALVVTNTFCNRPPDWLTDVSQNIVPCEPTLPGVIAALEQALARVEDFDSRAEHALLPANADWPQVFDAAFLEGSVGRLL